MNIIEAFKLLQDGKKIYHENMPYVIYQLIDKKLQIYRKYNNDNYYTLLTVDNNEFSINCAHDLEGWEQVLKPIPIRFYVANEFYKNGKTIKRIGLGKQDLEALANQLYNNNDLAHIQFSIEDIEAYDWEVVEE